MKQTNKLIAVILITALIMINAPLTMASNSVFGPEKFANKELALVPEVKNSVELKSFYQFPVKRSRFTGISTRFSAFHRAVDIRSPIGSELYSILPGEVVEVGFQAGGYGHYIIIQHENGMMSLYAHLSKVNVEVGQKVTSLTVIGEIGSTGRSTGPHLHLEIYQNGKALNPLDLLPEPVI